MVGEGRRRLLVLLRQRDPGLESAHRVRLADVLGPRPLGMGDALPRRHPVHVAGVDLLQAPDRVAVHDTAGVDVGDGGEPDMRVRPHVELLRDQHLPRPEGVEEDERPDHLPLDRRQHPPDREAPEVAGARQDDMLDQVGGPRVAEYGIDRGQRTHRRGLRSCRWPSDGVRNGRSKSRTKILHRPRRLTPA